MNFKISKSDLKSALSTVSKAVSPKSSISILEGILFTLESGALTLTGYDLEIGVTTTISAESFDEGKFVVQPKLIIALINKLSKDETEISVENDMLTIINGKTEMSLPCLSADEYPSITSEDGTQTIEIEQATLHSLVSQTLYAVAANTTKPILMGELFELSNNSLNVVALDGYRLAIRSESLTADDIKTVIPAKALNIVLGLLGGGNCKLHISRKNVKFEIGDYSIFTRTLEGEYHNYKQSIPKAHTSEITAHRVELIESLERCLLLQNDRIKSPVRVVFDTDVIKIFCKSQLGSISDTVQAENIGATCEVGYNPRYLIDSLKVLNEDKVTLKVGGANAPTLVESGNYTALVLPVRLKNE